MASNSIHRVAEEKGDGKKDENKESRVETTGLLSKHSKRRLGKNEKRGEIITGTRELKQKKNL